MNCVKVVFGRRISLGMRGPTLNLRQLPGWQDDKALKNGFHQLWPQAKPCAVECGLHMGGFGRRRYFSGLVIMGLERVYSRGADCLELEFIVV